MDLREKKIPKNSVWDESDFKLQVSSCSVRENTVFTVFGVQHPGRNEISLVERRDLILCPKRNLGD